MKFQKFLFFAFFIITTSFGADSPQTYADAKALWMQKKDNMEYQTYMEEFVQFNNHFHLDEKDGCYGMAQGPVDLMLIITHPKGNKFAVIEQVLSDVENEKAKCFKKTYRDIPTKIPPYLPFFLHMSMK